MNTKQITITVNGRQYTEEVRHHETLLEFIREDLGLFGTKEGCSVGECGACTVIMNGETINACLVLAAEADGANILTIEGLADGDKLHPIQEAFVVKGGLQCGFCTPGMILSTKYLLDTNSNPTDMEISKSLEGNFCRCTGYTKIFESVRDAAERVRG